MKTLHLALVLAAFAGSTAAAAQVRAGAPPQPHSPPSPPSTPPPAHPSDTPGTPATTDTPATPETPATPPSSDDSAALAQKLSNPVSSLISVPFQFNYDRGQGPQGDGERFTLNIQPVIPISLSEEWNVISRTILPLIHQDGVADLTGDDTQAGTGDILQSLFFSPKEPTEGGLIWGLGPALQIPTASEDVLGSEKFSIGPTVVLLRQHDGFTYGLLANHLWSVAGENGREDVNATFVQPFLAYTTHDAWTFTLNTETTFDWTSDQWSVPVNVIASKLLKIEGHPFQLFAGVRYWAESPDNGPDGFGIRLGITFLFPAN